MAKVTMYRGIDPTDGTDTVFAVCGDQMIRTFGCCDDWYKPESFGDFTARVTPPESDKRKIMDVLDTFEILWEADL